MGTGHDSDPGRPIAAPLERCAQLLGVDLAIVRELAAKVEPYICANGTRIWSQRQAIVLHHLVGLPVEEIGRQLGVPSGTVKGRLARGRAALARRLGTDFYPTHQETHVDE